METTVSQRSFSLFNEKHFLAIRIWHWTTFLVMSASLITVLLASTMFSTKSNLLMITEQIQKKGGIVTPVQARAVAHEYSDKLWMVHKYIGYCLCFLLLCRILIEAFIAKKEKLFTKIKNALMLRNIDPAYSDRNHYLWAKYGYLFFYLILFIMAVTGLGLAYEDVPLFKSVHKPLIQIHSITQYLIYVYILTHLIGVIRADTTNSKGIVSGMIHGGNL